MITMIIDIFIIMMMIIIIIIITWMWLYHYDIGILSNKKNQKNTGNKGRKLSEGFETTYGNDEDATLYIYYITTMYIHINISKIHVFSSEPMVKVLGCEL